MTIQLEAAPVSDDRGGSFIVEVLAHEVDDDATQVIEVVDATPDAEPEPPRRRWYRRVLDVLSRTLACVRESVGWLTSGVSNSARRRVYAGRHHKVKPVGHRIRVTMLGRDRSTSEYSSVVQQRCREAAVAQEDDLAFQPGDTFMDWLTVAHDSLRFAQFNRNHRPAHGRWLCS